MCALMLNFLRSVCTFCTKIYDSINNYIHNSKDKTHQEFGYCHIFVKTLICLRSSGYWTYIHIRKTQHIRFTINCGAYFLYLETFHSKYIMLLGLCLVLVNGLFYSIFLVGFNVAYPVKPENDFSHISSGYVCLPWC